LSKSRSASIKRELDDIKSALARHPRLTLSSNLILRKSPRFIELKGLIRDGLFGDIYGIEGDYLYGRLQKIVSGWRGEIEGYSVMHGGGIHLIDLLLWLLDEPVVEVAAMGNAPLLGVRGSAIMTWSCRSCGSEAGRIGKVSANSAASIHTFTP